MLDDRDRIDVLVVDDERIIADTLAMIRRMSGFITLFAYEGHSALEMARRVSTVACDQRCDHAGYDRDRSGPCA